MMITRRFTVGCLLAAMFYSVGMMHATAASDVQSKVEKYKQKLTEWAADPAIVAAVKEANAKGDPGVDNAKWEGLKDKDPQVVAILSSAASKKIQQWESDKGINKLYVRDAKGNLVAGSSKPAVFNVSDRPPFQQAMKGQPWQAKGAAPDPTTQVNSVQVSAPVMDGGKAIGVIHTAVSAE